MSEIIKLDKEREAIANEIYNTIMSHKDSSHYVLTNSIMSVFEIMLQVRLRREQLRNYLVR